MALHLVLSEEIKIINKAWLAVYDYL